MLYHDASIAARYPVTGSHLYQVTWKGAHYYVWARQPVYAKAMVMECLGATVTEDLYANLLDNINAITG